MSAYVKMAGDWESKLDPGIQKLLTTLTKDVLATAQRLVPVDTGDLLESLDSEVSGDTGRVGSKDSAYASYVELGNGRGPAQPYLRPALYSFRSP